MGLVVRNGRRLLAGKLEKSYTSGRLTCQKFHFQSGCASREQQDECKVLNDFAWRAFRVLTLSICMEAVGCLAATSANVCPFLCKLVSRSTKKKAKVDDDDDEESNDVDETIKDGRYMEGGKEAEDHAFFLSFISSRRRTCS